MKKLLVTLLLVVSSTAHAQWVLIAHSDMFGGIDHYINTKSIKAVNGLRQAWFIDDFRLTQEIGDRSTRSLYEFDCKTQRLRLLVLTNFSGQMGSGDVLLTTKGNDNWDYVAPEAVSESRFEQVCSK